MENGHGRRLSDDEEEIEDEEYEEAEYEEAGPLDQEVTDIIDPPDPDEDGEAGLYDDSEENDEAGPSGPEESEPAGPLDVDEDDEAGPLDIDEEPPKSLTPEFILVACSSKVYASGRPINIANPVTLESSDDHYTDGEDIEYGDAVDADADADDDRSQEQRDLTVTFKSEETNEEIATATLILKRHDSVDKFLPFVGALLRSIASEQLKHKLMEDITQILIDAKTEEIQRHRGSRQQ